MDHRVVFMNRPIRMQWKQLRYGQNYRLALAALLVCLPALLVYCWVHQLAQPFPDSGDYLDLARNLASYGHFRVSGDTTLSGEDSIIRTPGYPAQIAAASLIFGRHGFLVVNLLSLFVLAFMTLKIAARLGIKQRWSLLVLFLLSPGLVACTVSALTEVPFAAWLALTFYLLLRNRPGWAGLCLGMAVLIRPAGLYMFIIPCLWLLVKRRWWAAALFLVAANVLPLAWTMRNYNQFGQMAYTTLDGHYVLDYKAGSYLSWRDNVPWNEMCYRLENELPADVGAIECNRQAGVLGRQILRENMVGFILWMPRNLVNFLMPDITPLLERLELSAGNRGTLDLLRRQGVVAATKYYFAGNPPAAALTALYCAFYALVLLLIPFGIWRLWRQHRMELLLMLGLIAYLWVLPVGNLDWRFRMPAAALFFLLTAAGIAQLWSWRHQIKSRSKLC